MAERRYGAKITIDRPIEEVFAFLADGDNDPKFSERVQKIEKTTDGPPGLGTIYASTVRDAGVTTQRQFEYTLFEPPNRIRWTERSKNMVTVPEGGYDLEPAGPNQTQLSFFNVFEGHGIGKLFVGLAFRGARKQADDFAASIKKAVEAEPRG